MKKLISTVIAVVIITFAVNALATRKQEEAKEMVRRAVAYIKANGKEKALVEFNKPKGSFVKDELYVFVYDFNGVLLAYSQDHNLVGKNLSDLRDIDGKYFVREFLQVGKQQGYGWVTYKWSNPAKGKVEQKSTYVESVDDMIVACGVYKE